MRFKSALMLIGSCQKLKDHSMSISILIGGRLLPHEGVKYKVAIWV